MKILLIMNPGSKNNKSKKLFDSIFNKLTENEFDYDYSITKTLNDAYDLSLAANLSNKYDTIVAVGGDGTINRVLSGFYNNEGKRNSSARFSVIYTGSSPDFCKSYNIPIDIAEAVNCIVRENIKKIKIGKIKYSNFPEELRVCDSKNFSIGFFACCSNIGIGAELADTVNTGIRKYFGDIFGTFISLIKTLLIFKQFSIKIIEAGKTINLDRVCNISIGRTYFIASGIKIKNDLTLDLRKFYELIIQNVSMKNIFQILHFIYSGKNIRPLNYISLRHIEKIELFSDKNYQKIGVEFDGDRYGYIPCEISFAEEELEIICNE